MRIDSGFFSNQITSSASFIASLKAEPLGALSVTFRKGIFDIKSETYVDSGAGMPFVRISDMKNGLINSSSLEWISLETHKLEAKTTLRFGDIVLSKTAYAAASFVNVTECNVSQDIIAIRIHPKIKKRFKEAYIVAYLNSQIGLPLMARHFQGNVQQHLSIEDAKEILIPEISYEIQSIIDNFFRRSDKLGTEALICAGKAESYLLAALGLADWSPPEPLSYVTTSAEVFAAARLDAQYFMPKHLYNLNKLVATQAVSNLSDLLFLNTRGRQPEYAGEGLRVINSRHVRTNRIILDDENRFASENKSSLLIQYGDVLLNGTGAGTIGRAAPYLHPEKALPDNHVTVLRTKLIDPIFLSVFLNSPVGQVQIEQHIKGSSGQIELYPEDIGKLVIWDAPKETQLTIRNAVLEGLEHERMARYLLETAKRAVEIAIEQDEGAAFAFLQQAEEAAKAKAPSAPERTDT